MSSSEDKDLSSVVSCYLDNSATTRPFDEVIAAMSAAMADAYFNPSAAYAPGLAVEGRLEAMFNSAVAEPSSASMDSSGLAWLPRSNSL